MKLRRPSAAQRRKLVPRFAVYRDQLMEAGVWPFQRIHGALYRYTPEGIEWQARYDASIAMGDSPTCAMLKATWHHKRIEDLAFESPLFSALARQD